MATEFKWKVPTEALTTVLGSELNALANSTSDTTGFSGLSALEIMNGTDAYQYIELELFVGTQALARSSGAYIGVYIALAADGTTFEDSGNKAFAQPLALFPLDAAVTARRQTKANIPIPPVDFKLYALNATGQPLPATNNTVKMRRYNEMSITI
jgi:hypothetical protein